MKSMTLTLIVSAALFSLSGCSIVGEPIAEEVADVLTKYCEGEPYAARQLYRQSINAELAAAGHEIQVRCAGDPLQEETTHVAPSTGEGKITAGTRGQAGGGGSRRTGA